MISVTRTQGGVHGRVELRQRVDGRLKQDDNEARTCLPGF